MTNPCLECDLHRQKLELNKIEYVVGSGHDEKLAKIFKDHCNKCDKRWRYVREIEDVVFTNNEPGYEIYQINFNEIANRCIVDM